MRVVDEPLYAHYLRVTGALHPGREEVIAAMDGDGNAIMRRLLLEQQGLENRQLFLKHMAHHLVQLDLSFLSQTLNIFLIRDPVDMLPSLTIQVPHATLADTGLKRQWELFESLQQSGHAPAVLDSRQLLLNPKRVLKLLCLHIGIEFDQTMLSWDSGPREEDGVWAPHWYHAVHQSTGFSEYRKKPGFPTKLNALLADCKPWYEKLFAHAIRAN